MARAGRVRGCGAAFAVVALAAAAPRARAQTTPDLVVRTPAGAERRVPVVSVETAAGPRDFVRLDAFATAVGAQVTLRADGESARFEFGGAAVEVRDGLPYVRAGTTELPLAAAPTRDARGLLVPTQFAVDLVPRLVRSVAYDASTRTLAPVRIAARATARGARSGARTPTVAAAPTHAAESAADSTAPVAAAVRLASPPPRARPAADASTAVTADATADARLDAVGDASARAHRIVAVDAGHGGPDAGMRGVLVDGTPLVEKDVTLGVARALRGALMARGIGVVMTRTTDTLISLGDRGRIANARHADLFVSVHVNAANPGWRDPSAARGFETYFLSEARTEEARQVADRENASTRFETGLAPNGVADPLRFVMSDLASNAHLRESSRLAADVQTQLERVHPGPNRRVHQAGFKVLVTAAMPAVLVEVGFGSNPEDAAYLASVRGRRELAEAIASAVSDFLVRYVRKPAE